MEVAITPLTGSIGALVEGVHLGGHLDESVVKALMDAFHQYCTLVFREQYLSPEAHVRFARYWGEPVVTKMLTPMAAHPEVVQIANVGKEKTSTEAWHYDAPFVEVPPKISILSAITVPNGGDTMWSNQYLALESLSPAFQQWLTGLRVHFRGLRLSRMMGVPEAEIPHAVHPLVRTHPETGRKALYVAHSDNVVCIEGWTPEESRPLMDYLYAVSQTPDHVYRHMWLAGDIVMWDNRCTMHYAVHDHGSQIRVLNRVTLRGEAPA